MLLLAVLLLLIEAASLPTWPGSGVPMLLTKSGYIAVAGSWPRDCSSSRRRAPETTALVSPGVAHGARSGPGRSTVALLVLFRSRGALLVLVVGLIVARPNAVRLVKVAFSPASRWCWRLYVSGLSIEVSGRQISYGGRG